jgi:hypothetical protein
MEELIKSIEGTMIFNNIGMVRLNRWELNLDEKILYESKSSILKEYIKNGFLPIHDTDEIEIYEADFIEKYFYYGYDLEEISIWNNLDIDIVESDIDKIYDHNTWLFCNLYEWKNIAIQTGTSLPLLFYGKDYLYKSNRPKTDMSIFRQNNSKRYNPRIVRQEGKYIFNIIGELKGLPVTRYSSGMSKGLFYKEDNLNDKYCGTFYYYEPESTTYLIFKTYRIYRNKYQAYLDLYNITKVDERKKYIPISKLKNETTLEQDIIHKKQYEYYTNPSKFPDNLMMYPDEIDSSLKHLSKRQRYAGNILGLYALEDIFDQVICLKAREKNIDVILLTHMVGSHQIVSEVLDTRSRINSFSSLYYSL